MEDHESKLNMGTGHPVKPPGFVDEVPKALQDLLDSNPEVEEYVKSIKDVESEHAKEADSA